MSTERRSRGRFLVAFAGVVVLLSVLVAAGSVVALGQGPRQTGVSADPAAAIDTAGARVIFTTDQAVAPVDPAQVSVSPAADFTVDTSGRSIGVRFTVPLDQNTDYRITVSDVRGIGGGPTATLDTTVSTPKAQIYVLQRTTGADTITRSDVDGENAEIVFLHPAIEDFRELDGQLVVSVMENDRAALLVVDPATGDTRRITLPGIGYLGQLQVSERSGRIGFTYSDRELTETTGIKSQLFLTSLTDDTVTAVAAGGEAPSVDDWAFVPDSDAVLMVPFSGDLMLVDPAGRSEPVRFGTAIKLQGLSRGTYQAIVDKVDGWVALDLRAGTEEPLTLPDLSGTVDAILPLTPATTLWHHTERDAAGMPTAGVISVSDASGQLRELYRRVTGDPILQACASPSGSQVAALVAPDYARNPLDGAYRPLPSTLRTVIIDVASGEVVGNLAGFDLSWCERGPF
jgi:hypothetical protein